MPESLIIATENPALRLRTLTPDDVEIFFETFDANREYANRFNPNGAQLFNNLDAVETWVTNPESPDTRMGIWAEDELAGSIDLRPDPRMQEIAEIGYWLGESHTKKGYATLAVNALTAHSERRHKLIWAKVMLGNLASIGVLERAGYKQVDPFLEKGTVYRKFTYYTELSE